MGWARTLLVIFFLLWACQGVRAASAEMRTLAAINEAVEEGNSDKFCQLVNVDGILTDAINTFVAELAKPESAGKLPPVLALMFSNALGQEQVRQLLVQEGRAFVLNGVASGAFAGKQLPQGKAQGILAPIFASASLGRKEIKNPGEPVSGEKGASLLAFTVHDWGNDRDYPVVGRFAPTGAGDKGAVPMRLEAVENMPQIVSQILGEMAE